MDTPIIMKISLEAFFGKKIPFHFRRAYNDVPFVGYEYSQMIEVIDFHKPFLRTERIAIFQEEKEGMKNFRSIGMGTITPEDTEGHYNNTIYLAQCGQLMASTASVHLAFNFMKNAPQVVEADRVKPLKDLEGGGILKPRSQGTTFWVETIMRKRKINFILTTTNISFGNCPYGTIEDLKFMLIPKETIWRAMEVRED